MLYAPFALAPHAHAVTCIPAALCPCALLLQVLHDAFFKYQTKPKLSGMGELYYEGKEYEAKLTSARPGGRVGVKGYAMFG